MGRRPAIGPAHIVLREILSGTFDVSSATLRERAKGGAQAQEVERAAAAVAVYHQTPYQQGCRRARHTQRVGLLPRLLLPRPPLASALRHQSRSAKPWRCSV